MTDQANAAPTDPAATLHQTLLDLDARLEEMIADHRRQLAERNRCLDEALELLDAREQRIAELEARLHRVDARPGFVHLNAGAGFSAFLNLGAAARIVVVDEDPARDVQPCVCAWFGGPITDDGHAYVTFAHTQEQVESVRALLARSVALELDVPAIP